MTDLAHFVRGLPKAELHLHIEGSLEYYDNAGIAWNDKLQRPWAQRVITLQGAGTTASPNHIVYDTRLNSTSFGGYITAAGNAGNPLADKNFATNGQLSPYNHGTPVVTGIESGGDGGYYYQASLVSKTKMGQAYARFDYDFSNDMHAYVSASSTLDQNENNHQTNEFRNISLSATNAFLSPAQQATLTGHGFFSNLIAGPFKHGLIIVFTFALIMCLIAALASWLRGPVARAGQDGPAAPDPVRASKRD